MHYETAADAHTPEQIVGRCAERFECLAEDCIIFKWATSPHLSIAIKALELQGFRYVTSLVWNKERAGDARGPGYWFTGEHEIVLVGVRGKVVPPAFAHFRSSFSAPVGEHSEKPSRLHEIVEFHWPNTPKVEFNARLQRPGWTAWGFDAPVAPSLASLDAAEAEIVARLDADLAGADPAPLADNCDPLLLPDFLRRVPRQQTEMDLTRRDRVPPEVVDKTLQTRLPLTADEIDLHAALAAIAAGHGLGSAPAEFVDGVLQCRPPLSDEDRDLRLALAALAAGNALSSAPAKFVDGVLQSRLPLSDEGREFLAALVDVPRDQAGREHNLH